MQRFLWHPLLRNPPLIQVIMGILVLAQPQYLRFDMEDNTSSGIACFIVAIIEGVIFILLVILSGRKNEDVSRENYVPFESERDRPRESTFKGISMVDLPKMK